MVIPIDCVTKQNWERGQRGLAPVSEKKSPREEPEPPKIENQIRFEDVELTPGLKLLVKQRDNRKNSEGVILTGFKVAIETEPGKVQQGWLGDGDLNKLRPFLRDNTDPRILNSL